MENGRECEGSSEYDSLELYEGDILPLEDFLWKKVGMLESQNKDSAFFVADLGEIYRKLEDWRRLLPRVEPFFALKCNAHPVVTRFLADAGVGFDCASKIEIQQILDLGVHPSRIVYANPFKQRSYLTYAADHNVDLMTFDDVHELVKIKEYFPTARLLLRMTTRAEVKVTHNFNNKFGCPMKQCGMLLAQALAMKLNVVGVCFHVGSKPEQTDCFSSAIEDAYNIFKVGRALGFNMAILDIGGGFHGTDKGNMTFAKAAAAVNKSLEQYFPASDAVRVIAEPGRYFVTSAFTLTVNVIAKKVVNQSDSGDGNQHDILDADISTIVQNHIGKNNDAGEDRHGSMENGSRVTLEDSLLYMYIINQGIYGIFAGSFIDKAPVTLQVLQRMKETNSKMSRPRPSKIFGPTCAPCDCLISECKLPEIEVGQWFYFCNMGAYSFSLTSGFNGIEPPLVFPVCSQHYWHKMYPVEERTYPPSDSKKRKL